MQQKRGQSAAPGARAEREERLPRLRGADADVLEVGDHNHPPVLQVSRVLGHVSKARPERPEAVVLPVSARHRALPRLREFWLCELLTIIYLPEHVLKFRHQLNTCSGEFLVAYISLLSVANAVL